MSFNILEIREKNKLSWLEMAPIYGVKKFENQNFVGVKKMFSVKKIWGQKKLLGIKKFYGEKILGDKIWGEQKI